MTVPIPLSPSSLIRPHERPARPTLAERRLLGHGPEGGRFSTADRETAILSERRNVGRVDLEILVWETERVRLYATDATTGETRADCFVDLERVTRGVVRDPWTGREFSFAPPWDRLVPSDDGAAP